MGQGIIVINPYQIPKESVHQANRLKDELFSLGVSAEIVTDAFLRTQICENKIKSTLDGMDFVIYLDKDKYQSEILESLGVTAINPINEDFDPLTQEAIMQVPAEEGETVGKVKQVFLKGYKLGEKVIRYAQVVVIGETQSN